VPTLRSLTGPEQKALFATAWDYRATQLGRSARVFSLHVNPDTTAHAREMAAYETHLIYIMADAWLFFCSSLQVDHSVIIGRMPGSELLDAFIPIARRFAPTVEQVEAMDQTATGGHNKLMTVADALLVIQKVYDGYLSEAS
jgi:hypothetical protein